jgi:hypothetical protein
VSVQKLTLGGEAELNRQCPRDIAGAGTSTSLFVLLLCWVDLRKQYLQVNEVAVAKHCALARHAQKSPCGTCRLKSAIVYKLECHISCACVYPLCCGY